MKILKEERSVPQPATETVTTYELTQEEMFYVLDAIGCVRAISLNRIASDLFDDYHDIVMENQPCKL